MEIIFKKRYFVHRLVAFYFVPGYQEDLVVNHIDGDKSNNLFTNLEWVTRSENDLHAFALGLRTPNIWYKEGMIIDDYILTFDLNTNYIYNIYRCKNDFAEAERKSVNSIQEMLSRGYFINIHNCKIGIKRIRRTSISKPLIFD